jgi:hypothetical protein
VTDDERDQEKLVARTMMATAIHETAEGICDELKLLMMAAQANFENFKKNAAPDDPYQPFLHWAVGEVPVAYAVWRDESGCWHAYCVKGRDHERSALATAFYVKNWDMAQELHRQYGDGSNHALNN